MAASRTVLLAKKIDSSDGIRGCAFLFQIEYLGKRFTKTNKHWGRAYRRPDKAMGFPLG